MIDPLRARIIRRASLIPGVTTLEVESEICPDIDRASVKFLLEDMVASRQLFRVMHTQFWVYHATADGMAMAGGVIA